MPLILIDDREIEAKEGESLLRLCLNHGIPVPYYCWHPALSVVGQCRMCLVGVKGVPKPLTACSTTVTTLPPDRKIDGKYDMVVDTKSPAVKKDQRAIMEFLLLNHPLDCPICDQAGECELQEFSYTYGNASSRFDFEKEHAPKRVDMGPHVIYDAERCIKCTRCIRFCNEITGTGELTLVERGVHAIVDTFPGRELSNDYSVCTVDVCPVGALTSKEFRFKQRVWFLTSSNSVCQECARGCSVRVDTYKGEILRLVPRENPQVNGPWMCDFGRLVSERLKETTVLARPKVRQDGKLAPVAWPMAADALGEKLGKYGGEKAKDLALVWSGRMTLEEMAAAKALSAGLFAGSRGVAPMFCQGEDDALLIRRERRPNLKGAALLGVPVSQERSPLSTLLKGKKAAFIVREDLVGDADGEEREALKKALASMDLVVVADYGLTQTAALAHVFIPLAGWHEMEGTVVNFQGTVQKMARAVVPPRDRKAFYEVVSHWLRAAGLEAPDPTFLAWHAEVRRALPAMRDVSIRDLLPNGVKLEAAP
jgi:NADH-quinone oxidoreductase subunit G